MDFNGLNPDIENIRHLEKNVTGTSIIPLFIQLIYQAILSIDVPSTASIASSSTTDSTNQAVLAVGA